MLVRNYVKRLRMEAPLRRLAPPAVPGGFRLVPWRPELVRVHAEVKWLCFRQTLDSQIFPNLARPEGCQYLMSTIAEHPGFVPEATWLACTSEGYCGCIQGVAGARQTGMIQNLGVFVECRGLGIGRALLMEAMIGFREVGLSTVQLEVCARNTRAVRLYRSVGFETRKTLYRETQAEFTEYAI